MSLGKISAASIRVMFHSLRARSVNGLISKALDVYRYIIEIDLVSNDFTNRGFFNCINTHIQRTIQCISGLSHEKIDKVFFYSRGKFVSHFVSMS